MDRDPQRPFSPTGKASTEDRADRRPPDAVQPQPGQQDGGADSSEASGARLLLEALGAHGIPYLLANSGTDFPPVIEALAGGDQRLPRAILVPHETAAVAMAHGYYLATGKPLAAMVHVNVGLANAVMGVINAASDNIPVLLMSGRTPITQQGRGGSRETPIQYGQEMYDQSSLVADQVKFHYEMRYPEQAPALVARSLELACAAPAGPVYLSLPREPLSEAAAAERMPPLRIAPASARAAPDPEAIATLAGMLAEAESPLILCARGDPEGRLSTALDRFCRRHRVPVAEPFATRNVLAYDHEWHAGYAPFRALAEADLVVVLDCAIPWITRLHGPPADARVVHLGDDPLFAKLPMRDYPADLVLPGDPALTIAALDAAMDQRAGGNAAKRTPPARPASPPAVPADPDGPSSAAWLARCLREALGPDALVFNELGVSAADYRPAAPNRVFTAPASGGLGWGLGAALGAQLADRERLVCAVVGDGSYIFANPVACHQVAEAERLPILVVVKNNGMWNAVRRSVLRAHPEGRAVQSNVMPLTSLEPSPDYAAVAGASRAHAERVTTAAALPHALARALAVIRDERRQALLDVAVELSDDS